MIVIINQFIINRPKKKGNCQTSKSHGQQTNSNQNYIKLSKANCLKRLDVKKHKNKMAT